MKSIDKKTLEEKKVSLLSDIDKLNESISQLGEQQKQLQANLFALHGALQQCDQFLELVEEEKGKDE